MFSILRIICLLAFILAANQSGFCSESDSGASRVSGNADGDTSIVGDPNQSSGSAEPEVVTKPRVPHQNSDFIKKSNDLRDEAISKVEPPPKPQAKTSANNKSSNSKPTQKNTNNPITKKLSKKVEISDLNNYTGASSKTQLQSLLEVSALTKKGRVLYHQGEHDKALHYSQRVLAICEKVLGPQHISTSRAIFNVAQSYRMIGDYSTAQELYERSLAIKEKVIGLESPDVDECIAALNEVYCNSGNEGKAEELRKRVLEIREKALGPCHEGTLLALSELSTLYGYIGNPSKHRELSEYHLELTKKTFGLNTSATAASLCNLAWSYSRVSDHVGASKLYEQALAMQNKILGSEHPETLSSLGSVATCYSNMGDNTKAQKLFQRALELTEKVQGSWHKDTAEAIRNLAWVYTETGDYSKARELAQRSLKIDEKRLGPTNVILNLSLTLLAEIEFLECNYAKAKELQQRVLDLAEKSGFGNGEVDSALEQLVYICRNMGDLGSAQSFASRAAAVTEHYLQPALLTDEKSRLCWQKEFLSMDIFACVSRPEQIAQLSLRWKGVVLDSLMEDRALTMAFSKNENSSKVLQELQGLRTQLAKIAFDQNKKEEADKISEKIGAIQRSMASLSTRFGRVRASADLTVDTILPALSGGSVFVDFIEFSDPKLKEDERLHYGAILIAEDGTPAFIRIPDRVAIDSAADAIRTAVKNGDEQSLQENLATLSTKLWQPVAEKIPAETKRIIVSPDGKLSFISFASLLDGEGKFICEKYLISYVASGRDLAKQDAAKENKTITLFANPKFDLNSTKKIGDRLAMRSSEISAFGDIQLPPLLGTEEECKALKQAAISTGWNPTTYVGAEATEQQIRSVKNTGILHLATHGFYLNAFTPAKDDTRGMSITSVEDSPKPQAQNGADPMRASGIALSGAQNTIKEWSKGKCPDPENDGILTAEEVAGLNLDGTWIVTLSACETGIGEARSGEGVFGLRRAFMMAGSKNLIMTLWAVNDASTAEIMADFYKRCFASSDASRSLAETQRDWLLKIKKDKGLLAAVRDAGPFVIATTGKP